MKIFFNFLINFLKTVGFKNSPSHVWYHQHLSSIIMIFLLPWFFYGGFLSKANQSYDGTVLWLQSPLNAILLSLTIICVMSHARLGLETIVRDYVHHKLMHQLALLLVDGGCRILMIGAVIAIIIMHLS